MRRASIRTRRESSMFYIVNVVSADTLGYLPHSLPASK
jgi:hypothetical protein